MLRKCEKNRIVLFMKNASPYQIAPLIDRIKAFAEARSISGSYASRLIFGDGSRLAGLEDGKASLTIKSADKAWRKLNELEGTSNAPAS